MANDVQPVVLFCRWCEHRIEVVREVPRRCPDETCGRVGWWTTSLTPTGKPKELSKRDAQFLRSLNIADY